MLGQRHTRRTFLRTSLAGAGGLALGAALPRSAAAAPAVSVAGPYGALRPFDANGLALPPGFTSRLIARGGQQVAATGYTWHTSPDGGGTFAALGGGWYLVSNSERAAGAGGVSVIRFASDGTITEAGQLLGATTLNCSGGVTPWGTYLSCEEFEGGNVWEVDPTGLTPPVRRPLLGTFQHEAACVDPVRQHVYLTEDKSDGCLYRFRPTAYPDLSAGVLEVAIVAPDSTVTWQPVPDPGGAPTPTRKQVAGATVCNGGEGMWYDDGIVYFTTKGDRRVWMYHAATSRIEILYDLAKADADTPLRDVDNCVVSKSGDLFICEDGDNLEICMITPDRYISAFLRLDGVVHNGPAGPSSNETTGVVFDPSGTRMYFAAQRSFGGGAIYEVSGPFRLTRPAAPVTPVNRPVTPPPAAPVATDPPAPTPPAPVAPDTARPVVSVQSLARTLKMRAFLDRGLSVQFAISEPAGIELELRAPGFGVLARQRTNVAVSGLVRLRLRVGAAALRKRLRRRRGRTLKAELVIRVVDPAGNRTTLRRTVRISTPR